MNDDAGQAIIGQVEGEQEKAAPKGGPDIDVDITVRGGASCGRSSLS